MEFDDEYILEMNSICKSFPGVHALKNVSLKVRYGTVHTLMGENGAGKSTLMKILSGIYQMDSGEIIYKKNSIYIHNPAAAIKKGIAIVHQELSPIPDMTVAENIFVGREPIKLGGIVDRKKMVNNAKTLFTEFKININPNKIMRDLSVAEMQMVEIVKAVSYNAEILILDEPTSAISDEEVKNLFKIIKTYTQSGKSVIYISHKMEEIFKISDEITVLRDGEYIDTKHAKNVTRNNLIQMMVGRSLEDIYPKIIMEKGDVTLRVSNLCLEGKFKDISFEARKGEILGISGLMGAGRSELVESIFGITPPDSGSIFLNGEEIKINSPSDAIGNGIALITEDRKETGLNLLFSVKKNITIANLKKLLQRGLIINEKKEKIIVEELIKKLSIKTPSQNTIVNSLSGGNQQKVVIAKWLLSNPEIMILDEPTRGIDVGAKAEVHKLMNKLVQEGKTVIMISSELPEIMGMSDRILVLSEGVITGEFQREDFDQEKILACAMNHLGEE